MALFRAVLVFVALAAAAALPAQAQTPAQASTPTYSSNEILDAGHRFFGGASRDLALLVEKAAKQWGEPNGYILGQEASGAITIGLRYGEGALHTRNAGSRKIYWQGPSVGFDLGGNQTAIDTLKTCATTGDGYFANASSPEELNAAFSRFAGKLTELRLSK